MALRIAKNGLKAIDVEGEAGAARKETSLRPAPAQSEVETPAPKAAASHQQVSVATQKSARKKHHPGKAKTKAGSRRESQPGLKQARVLAMLGRPEGATLLPSCARPIGSGTGFFAGVVRKRMKAANLAGAKWFISAIRNPLETGNLIEPARAANPGLRSSRAPIPTRKSNI